MSPADSAHHPVEVAESASQFAGLSGRRLGFWRRPGVLRAAPMLSSFVFHTGILLIAILLIRAIPQIMETDEPPLVASFNMVDPVDLPEREPAGIDNEFLNKPIDPTDPSVPNPDWSNTEIDRGLIDPTEFVPTAIGPGLNNPSIGGNNSSRPRQSRIIGITRSPAGIFTDTDNSARKIVYVCDASGSIGTSPARKRALVSELKKAIDNLQPHQWFNIAFFSFDDPIALSNGELLRATPENQQAAYDFLDKVVMSGQTDPIPALKLAFRQNPELIYLLTDGEFTAVEPQSVIDAIQKLGARKKVMINTIMLDNDSKTEQQTLKEIASMTGGDFMSATAQEINRSDK